MLLVHFISRVSGDNNLEVRVEIRNAEANEARDPPPFRASFEYVELPQTISDI